jgi:lipooligosaccharide transport system permease protein
MTSVRLGLRATPPALIHGLRAQRIIERNVMVARRAWLPMVSGFFEPVFYLFSIGVGVGGLVGDLQVDGRSIPYATFVAPALLASSAMNGAVFESTFNIFFKLKFGKVYDAMLTTPLRPIDIATGEVGYSLLRGGLYSMGFMVVMALYGLTTSWWAVMAVPASLLIALAFASVGLAATTFMRSWQDFDLVNLVTLPLFLFSATFYPLDVYPPFFQNFTRFSPLYHGVELIRGFTLGVFDPSMIGHAAVLVAMSAAGITVAGRRLEKLLLT